MAAANKVGGAVIELKTVMNPFNTDKIQRKLKEVQRDLQRGANHWRAYGDTMKRAERIQRSFLDRFKAGWERGILTGAARGEGSMGRLSTAFEIAGQAFEKIRGQSQLAALNFQRLQRVGIFLQSGLGVLAGTLGDIAGGFLSLVGVVGQASGSLYGIVGAIATFVAGGIVAKFALGGIGKAVSQLWQGQEQYNKALIDAKRNLRDLRFAAEEAALSEEEAAINLEKARETLARVQDLPPDNRVRREAELAFKQAELNYRKVKAAGDDARDDAKRGIIPSTQTDPFKNLTASQKVFARYILTTKSAIMQLKESAAGAFLPGLKTAIEGFIKNVFPTLNAGFKDVGDGLSSFVNRLSDAFQTPENLKSLREFFANTKDNLDLFGKAAADGLGAFLSLLVAIQPLIDRFGEWLQRYFGRLDTYFKSAEFEKFVNKSMEVAGILGDIFHDVFTGIGNIMKAAFPDDKKGGGYILLSWLDGITEGFKAFTGSKDFQKWLADSTRNATTALSTIGQFLHIFLDLAGSLETFEFWTIIREAIDPLKAILRAGMMAGPAFAKFLVSFTKFIAIFTDNPGMMINFFETLTKIVDVLAAVFGNPIVKYFLDAIASIHGVFLAIAVTLLAVNTAGKIFFGTMSLITGALEGYVAGISKAIVNVKTFISVLQQLGGKLKSAYLNFQQFVWGFKAGNAAQMAFYSSLNKTYGITDKFKAGILAIKDAYLRLGMATANVAGSMANKLYKSMDSVKVRALMMANSVERVANRIVKAYTKMSKRFFMPAIPVMTRRQKNRALMDSMANDQGMTRSPIYDKRIPLLQRLEDAKTRMLANAEKLRNKISETAAMKRMQITRSVIRTGMKIERGIESQGLRARAALEAKGFYDYTKAVVPRYMAFAKNVAKATGFNIKYYTSVAKDAVKSNVGKVLTTVGNSFTAFGRKIAAAPTAIGLGWLNMTQRVRAGFKSLGRDMISVALKAEAGINRLKTSIFVTGVITEIKLNRALANLKARFAAFRADNTFEQLRGKIFAAAVVAEIKFNKAINTIKANISTMRDNGVAAFQKLGRNMLRAAINADLQFRKLKTTLWVTAAVTEIRMNVALRKLKNRFAELRASGVASLRDLNMKMIRLAITTDLKVRKAITNIGTTIKNLPATTAAAFKNMGSKIQSGFGSLFTPIANRLKSVGTNFAGALSNASANAARASRLSWAASLGATEAEMQQLSAMMDGLTAKEIRASAGINAMLPGYGGIRGTAGRFAGKAGLPLMAAGFLASSLSSLGSADESQGGQIGNTLMMAGGIGMMLGPVGMAVGGLAMLAGGITAAFEARAKAEKEKADAAREKSYEINIKNAQINAENVAEARTGLQALVAKYGKTFDQAADIMNNFTTQVGSRVWDPEKAFSTFAPYLTGKNAKQLTDQIADAIQKLRTSNVYSEEDAISQIADILENGFQGKKGVDAITKFIGQFKNAAGDIGTVTSKGGKTKALTGADVAKIQRDSVTKALYSNLSRSYASQVEMTTKFIEAYNGTQELPKDIAAALVKNVSGFKYDSKTGVASYKDYETSPQAISAALQAYAGSTVFATLRAQVGKYSNLAEGKAATTALATATGTGTKVNVPKVLSDALAENKRKQDPAYLLQLKQYSEAQLQSIYLQDVIKVTKDKDAKIGSLDRDVLLKALTAPENVTQYMPYNNPSLWMPGANG